jgi:glutathione S-transferase
MIYPADQAGKLLPTESKARSNVMQWLIFQTGGIGPMMGQANVFYHLRPSGGVLSLGAMFLAQAANHIPSISVYDLS